ncbi:O-antigen ligase family protein [Corynebacterium pseudopelargi]|uniref:O-Antigen ligase n=1 Tax=Corynebacterium pseudopelargi TaxID=2080757 RepID=A0A3G6IRM3_9CORY|nr:O-antigen ligase family protein [Corynebacterium pseudopelargi]AZA08245.1 O-Antigen ligase [Corynebacterium pseudopelargi]
MLTFYSVLAAIIAAPLAIWFSMVWFRRPAFAMGTGAALSVLSLTQFFPDSLRLALAASLVPHAITALYAATRGTSPNKDLRFPSVIPVALYVGMCALSILWSLDRAQTITSTLAWVVLAMFALTFRQLVPYKKIRVIFFYILLGFFIACIFALLTPFGWAGGRARGVFQNANASAIFAFLLAGLSIWMGKKYYRWLLPLCFVFIFITGSRAGMLGFIAVVVVSFYWRMNTLQKLFSFGLALIALFPVGNVVLNFLTSGETDAVLLRTDNTREDTTVLALDFIKENPWLGAGYRATPPGLGSNSYLKLLAEFGIVAIFAGVVLAIAYISWSRVDSVMFGLTIATLIDCLFEDWLLTAGAPMLLIYFVLLMSTPQPQKDEDTGKKVRKPYSPAEQTLKL